MIASSHGPTGGLKTMTVLRKGLPTPPKIGAVTKEGWSLSRWPARPERSLSNCETDFVAVAEFQVWPERWLKGRHRRKKVEDAGPRSPVFAKLGKICPCAALNA